MNNSKKTYYLVTYCQIQTSEKKTLETAKLFAKSLKARIYGKIKDIKITKITETIQTKKTNII